MKSQKCLLFPVSRWKVFKVVCRRGQNSGGGTGDHAGVGFRWVPTKRTSWLCTAWYDVHCVHLFRCLGSLYSFTMRQSFPSSCCCYCHLLHVIFWFDLSEPQLQTFTDSSLSDQQPPAKRKYVLKNKANATQNTYTRGRVCLFLASVYATL